MSDKKVNQKRIIYYDSKGRRLEKNISPELQRAILKLFNGQLKAVARTSGGLGLAMPNGIKFRTKNEVLIRLNCKDFSLQNEKITESSENRPKYLPLEKVQESFPLVADEKQRYVVDLGHGIIPVCVVDFIRVEPGEMAVFLESGWEQKKILQPYWIPKECLRWAREKTENFAVDEWQLALANYSKLTMAGKAPIPEILERGPEIKVSGAPITLEWLKTNVQSNLRSHDSSSTLSATLNLADGNGLIPFGLFERT